MITAVTQTLAEILARGSPLIRTEQIDFNHPRVHQDRGPRLNLYCYALRENQQMQQLGQLTEENPNLHRSCIWFDVSFLVSAWDSTGLGELRLLSEALRLLLHYRFLPEKQLPPALQGYGKLPMKVGTSEVVDTIAFWSALGVPLRPALVVTVTIPFQHDGEPFIPEKEMLLLR